MGLGFLERGFRCVKEGVALLVLSHFSLISHENENNLVQLRPNYFIFMVYLKTGTGAGGSSEPLDPPLDSPLELVPQPRAWIFC